MNYADKIGSKYANGMGKRFTLIGIMLGDDDWYWVMWPSEGTKIPVFLSCVGDIEGFGYDPIG